MKSRFDSNTGGADPKKFTKAVCDLGFTSVAKVFYVPLISLDGLLVKFLYAKLPSLLTHVDYCRISQIRCLYCFTSRKRLAFCRLNIVFNSLLHINVSV